MRQLQLLIPLLLFVCASSWAHELQGRVVGVVDGDTVDVLSAERVRWRVRVAGIDSPEKKQAFGQKAKQVMSDLVYYQTVTIVWTKKDRNDRLVGKILREGSDIGLHMIRLGMAWHFKKYASTQSPQDRDLYANAEIQARAGRRGLWADQNVLAPWEFRAARTRK